MTGRAIYTVGVAGPAQRAGAAGERAHRAQEDRYDELMPE